jgi:hypothetical protein
VIVLLEELSPSRRHEITRGLESARKPARRSDHKPPRRLPGFRFEVGTPPGDVLPRMVIAVFVASFGRAAPYRLSSRWRTSKSRRRFALA